MIAAKAILNFTFFSFCGWVYECIYCSVKEGGWRNRGFLYGPVCPIYGTGVTALIIISQLLSEHAAAHPTNPIQPTWWQVFLVCMIGSAILEFVTSWVLEKLFHAVWWDYSNVPLNIQGRICLPASLGFGAAGTAIFFILIPQLQRIPQGAVHPILTEIGALICAFILGADLALTVNSLMRIQSKMDAMEEEFNLRMESGYQRIRSTPANVQAAAQNMVQKVQDGAGSMAQKVQDGAGSMAQKVQDGAETVVHRMQDSAENVAQRMQDSAESVVHRMQDSAENLAQKVQDGAENLAQKVQNSTDTVVTRLATRTEEEMHISPDDDVDGFSERISSYMNGMTWREMYHLRSITEYRPSEKIKSESLWGRTRKRFGEMQKQAKESGFNMPWKTRKR